MAHYLIAHLNGGRYGDAQVLSEAGMNELHRGALEYVKMGISSGCYAMGWFDTDNGHERFLWHGGNVPDFSAYMALLPEHKKGVVLLINADHYGLPPVMAEVGWGLTSLLAGQQPGPARLGFLPWVMRSLPLIPLLQAAGAISTLRAVCAWEQNPALRPNQGRLWGEQILLPLLPNLSLAALMVYLHKRGVLRFMHYFTPDVAWITSVAGRFAGFWIALRTLLLLRVTRRRHPSP
jgi:CubicO group peptidase (beta-lactamase class C family)